MRFHTLEQLIAATASGVRPPERLTVAEAAESIPEPEVAELPAEAIDATADESAS